MIRSWSLTAVPVAALALLAGDNHAAAQGLAYFERDVEFSNGPVELHGTLIMPYSDEPVPAVVFLHGSGPATREGARQYAETFAAMGLASLFFDKRGSGSSSGSWITASLEDLAADARSAIETARSQPEIDERRVGLWGVSQAAWIATLVASRDPDIAFLTLISGGGASPRESELFSYGEAFSRAGLSDAQIGDGFAAIDAYFAYLSTGEGREALLARLASGRDEAWYSYARLDQILPDEANRSNWSWVADWDPSPYARRITCPVLLLFGDRDTDHPTDLAVKRWDEDLGFAGNDQATVMVFPGAGHGIRMRDSHTGDGRAPFADGYLDVMLGWLWRNVVAAAP